MYCKYKNVWNTESGFARYIIVKFCAVAFRRFRIFKRQGKKNVAASAIFFFRVSECITRRTVDTLKKIFIMPLYNDDICK